MSRAPGAPKRGQQSKPLRRLRKRFSNLQVLLYPLLGLGLKPWRWLVARRVTVDRRGPICDFIREGKPCIITLWHRDVFPVMFELMSYTPRYPSLFLVSHGRVGQLGGYLLSLWGIEYVSGSRSRKGIAAVGELVERQRETGKAIFVLCDGSRGPAREARWGAVHMARDTGLPIVPVCAWSDSLWTLRNTWMRLVLPKPWGRAVLLSAEPVHVPPDADKPGLETARQLLEARLNEIADASESYFTEGPHIADLWGPPVSTPLI